MNVKEIREKIRGELLDKWQVIIDNLKDRVDVNQGNFVPHYYRSNIDSSRNLIYRDLQAIEYHLRMLSETKEVIERYEEGRVLVDKNERYAVQRLENAITLLENIRAGIIYDLFMNELIRLNTEKTKKNLLLLDKNLTHNLDDFNERGYVKEYLK
jgi:hypothetical protein